MIMKNLFFTIFIIFSIFSVHSQSSSLSEPGKIIEMTGEVELKLAGSSTFNTARVGSEVHQDTIVSTGFRSTAIIKVGSTTITVRPLTRLTLAQISESSGTENLNVNLQAGRVRVDVKPPAGTRANATMQSPSATASVRGTSFEMDTVSINVIEGKVGYNGNSGYMFVISEGFASEVFSKNEALQQHNVSEQKLSPPNPVGTGLSGAPSLAPPVINTGDVEMGLPWLPNP